MVLLGRKTPTCQREECGQSKGLCVLFLFVCLLKGKETCLFLWREFFGFWFFVFFFFLSG